MQQYQLRGEVVALDDDNRTATIRHEEIVGWMAAMTMPFPVKEDADWDKLAVGAQVEATVFVSEDGFHIGEVTMTGSTAGQPTGDGEPPAQPAQDWEGQPEA